jgi:hypothetical protein
MKSAWKNTALLLATSLGVAACGGGSSSGEQGVNTDYSNLRLATSSEGGLQYATSDESLLGALRNGLRMSLVGASQILTTGGPAVAAAGGPAAAYSSTTVQVEGVDEADLVKYDGERVYAVIPKPVPSTGLTRNVLKIARTNPATAQMQVLSEFNLEGEYSTPPALYQVQSVAGDTEYLVAVSQDYQAWLVPQPLIDSLVMHPDRTTLQLVDVRDPFNVSQAWKIELNGWMRGSRKIGDTVYLISSYRPRLPDLVLPADTIDIKEANERRILGAKAADLLPRYRINGGAEQPLVTTGDCVLPANLSPQDAYADLLIVTAIDLSERRVADVNCVSTNLNGVYVSTNSLYVGGQGTSGEATPMTALHKFALNDGDITYRATGVVGGTIGWMNASYYMDEHNGDLRIVTSASAVHRLSVLRETNDRKLSVVAAIPNAQRPAAIGKQGEQVHAVRFFGDRAYVVTARVTDPLYAIDLSNPIDPFIAGQLEIPGVSTYLQPIGPAGAEVLLAVGRELDPLGVRTGVKIELFDVSDMSQPRSLGVQVFGQAGSSSEAVDDPHALTLLPLEQSNGYRIALPINVYDRPDNDTYRWRYSGMHMLQIDGLGGQAPQLSLAGVIKTAEPDGTRFYPPHAPPNRAVLHDESVFVVSGDALIGSLWDRLGSP